MTCIAIVSALAAFPHISKYMYLHTRTTAAGVVLYYLALRLTPRLLKSNLTGHSTTVHNNFVFLEHILHANDEAT